MSQLDPGSTTIGDLVQAALREAGALGVGQTALANDTADAWARIQWMLQQWERKRWIVYRLADYSIVSTGAQSYSVGPGGDLDTGTRSARPTKLSSAFIRQLQTVAPNQVDRPLEVIEAKEDYNRIGLKQLTSFPQYAFLDTDFPLATLYCWPVPNANIYEIHISVAEQFPYRFATINTVVTLPYEYYAAIIYNGALRLRPKYHLGTYPGDMVPALARDSMGVLRGANTQIARLHSPSGLIRGRHYNIFSDQNY